MTHEAHSITLEQNIKLTIRVLTRELNEKVANVRALAKEISQDADVVATESYAGTTGVGLLRSFELLMLPSKTKHLCDLHAEAGRIQSRIDEYERMLREAQG